MSKLLIDEFPLMVMPKLAVKIGLNEAIVIQQVHYWLLKSEHEIEGKKWCYNSFKEWNKQFPFWCLRTIKGIFDKLEKSNLLLVDFFNKSSFDRTKWYSINYDILDGFHDLKADNNSRTIDNANLAPLDSANLAPLDSANLALCSLAEINTEINPEIRDSANFSSKTKPKKKSGAWTRSTPYPSGFVVTDEMRVWAKELGVRHVDRETEHWRDYHESKGSTFKSWPAAWRTWMRNSVKFGKGKGVDDGMSRFDKAKSQWEGLV